MLSSPYITPQQAEEVLEIAMESNKMIPLFFSQVSHLYARRGDTDGVLGVAARATQGILKP